MIILTLIWKEKKKIKDNNNDGKRSSRLWVSDWMRSPVLDGVVLLHCWLISLSTLLSLSPGFTSAPSFSVPLTDSENHGLITLYTGDWQGAEHKAKMLLSLWLTLCSVCTDCLNDWLRDGLRNKAGGVVTKCIKAVNSVILNKNIRNHTSEILVSTNNIRVFKRKLYLGYIIKTLCYLGISWLTDWTFQAFLTSDHTQHHWWVWSEVCSIPIHNNYKRNSCEMTFSERHPETTLYIIRVWSIHSSNLEVSRMGQMKSLTHTVSLISWLFLQPEEAAASEHRTSWKCWTDQRCRQWFRSLEAGYRTSVKTSVGWRVLCCACSHT